MEGGNHKIRGCMGGGMGCHLDPSRHDIVPKIIKDYKVMKSAAEVKTLDVSSMRKGRAWLPYRGAGLLKYSTIKRFNSPMSWLVNSIINRFIMSRGWIRRGVEWRVIFMALGVPFSPRCCYLWLHTAVILYEIEEGSIPFVQLLVDGSGLGPCKLIPVTMAPKRECPSPSSAGQKRPLTRRASNEDGRAARAAHFFKSTTPLEIQADIEKVEQWVWEENKQGIPEEEFKELAEWIQDPGSTNGRMTLYKRAISYFWAAKCIAARTAIAQKASTPKALAPAPLWNHHFNDARLMHKKIDIIAGKLGVHFAAPEASLAPPARPRAAAAPNPQVSHAQIP